VGELIDLATRREALRDSVVGDGGKKDEIHGLIGTELVRAVTQSALRSLMDSETIIVPAFTAEVSGPPAETEVGQQGVCFIGPIDDTSSKERPLFVDDRFPTFLRALGVDEQKAGLAGAVFARSLHLVDRAVRKTSVSTFGKSGSMNRLNREATPEIWKKEILRSKEGMIYRAAGTIATTGMEINLGPSPGFVLAPHIAGMFDPIRVMPRNSITADGTFRELSEMLQYSLKDRKVSEEA